MKARIEAIVTLLVAAFLRVHSGPAARAADFPPVKASPRASADGTGTQAPEPSDASSVEAKLHEYEIRLAAHRRELMQREAALEAARRRIQELTAARATEEPSLSPRKDPAPPSEAAEADPPIASPAAPEPSTKAPSEGPPPPDPDLVTSLRQELDTERENRATLEKEIQRLVSDSRSPEQLDELARSLEGARAEILVLTHRLEEERRARETLEVEIERVRSSAGIPAGRDWADRFERAMAERRQQAERLRRELAEANETIVALRGKLETAGPGASGDAATLAALAAENKRLQRTLEGAERANSELRTQAELASRLAELLYAQPMN